MLTPDEWNNPGAVHAWNRKVEADRREWEREERKRKRAEIFSGIKQEARELLKEFLRMMMVLGATLVTGIVFIAILESLSKMPLENRRSSYEQVIDDGRGVMLTVYFGCQGRKVINFKTLDVAYTGTACHPSQ